MSVDPAETTPTLAQEQARIAEYWRTRSHIAEAGVDTLAALEHQHARGDVPAETLFVLFRSAVQNVYKNVEELNTVGATEYWQRRRDRL